MNNNLAEGEMHLEVYNGGEESVNYSSFRISLVLRMIKGISS